MKLRLRALESKETIRIEIPNDCSFQRLKEAIAQSIPSSSPSSLFLSLNRKDHLSPSSPHDSLQSLGITAGDLVFYSIIAVPSASSPQTLTSDSQSSVQVGPRSNIDREHSETLGNAVSHDQDIEVSNLDAHATESDMSDLSSGEVEEGKGDLDVEVAMETDDGPEPSFLWRVRRILSEELGEDGGDHKRMVIAVHAVLLESGFVGFDSVSGTRVDRFRVLDEWRPSMAFTVSFHYTLPEILCNSQGCATTVIDTVVLKFQIMGHFVNVFGSLISAGSGTYRVCLDERRLAPIIGSLSPNGDSEREVYEFRRIVKDGVALPLLIDLCAKAGLPCPPCFMRLPSELLMKILEFLPGADIAKMGCVCKELRYLCCNNDLWKKKFGEEFGGQPGTQTTIYWKKAFATYWQSKKRSERRRQLPHYGWRVRPLHNPIIRVPYPLQVPRIGGDYDHLPGLVPPPFGRRGRYLNFSPNCTFGEFNG